MKIEIVNLEFLFSLLESLPKRDVDPSDGWKGEIGETSPKKEIGGIKFNPCELLDPLDYAGLFVHRMGELYAADYLIFQREKSAFRKLSRRFGEAVSQTKREWVATTNDGTGYIVSNSDGQRVIAAVMEKGNGTRSIGFGTNGACPRILSSQDVFVEEMRDLENIGNIFINCCYDSARKNQDLRLYLTL